MADQHRILLIAANGRTGRAILRELSRRGLDVRVLIRRTDQYEALSALGASGFALGDLLDPASIERASAGCRTMIYIGPPMHPDELAMATHCLASAAKTGVAHFVYYSVLHSVCRDIRHHRLKLEAEERVVNQDVPFTILQPARYMQHLEPLLPEIRASHLHSMPFDIDARFNVVDLADLASAVGEVVASPRHLYATHELAGPEALSQRDMAAILSDVLGTRVEARALAIETMQERARRAGASEDRVEQMTAMNRHYDSHGMLGNSHVLASLLGRAPTTFRDYVTRVLAANR